YSHKGMPSQISAARQFLAYLREERISIEETCPSDVDTFVHKKLREFWKRNRCLPRHPIKWRSKYTGPIQQLLRMVRSKWPPLEPPANDRERFHYELCEGYGQWLTEVQGLSKRTLRKNGDAARLFLCW